METSSATRGPPKLPVGTTSSLRGITDNFSFHASPEAFIARQIRQVQEQNPDIADRRTPVRAKILNRNVIIISSYQHVQSILTTENKSQTFDPGNEEEPDFVASKAYDDLMSKFFPAPNLLLSDGCLHRSMKGRWIGKMEAVHEEILNNAVKTANVFFSNSMTSAPSLIFNKPVDLYESMKDLSWRILLEISLGIRLPRNTSIFAEFQNLQETLLRGQFSLVPISVNTRLWRSSRSKGIEARQKLQDDIIRMIQDRPESICLGRNSDTGEVQELVNHLLMMTSSLAVKGLASLLTAYMLNFFVFEHKDKRLCETAASLNSTELQEHLRSIYLETERLSMPIVGVMRRLTRDYILEEPEQDNDILLPTGWDCWLYLVAAGRDPNAFGADCNIFNPGRYLENNSPEPVGFGGGQKTCLGKDLMRDICVAIVHVCLQNNIRLDAEVREPGLRAWLGWEEATPEVWAASIKQLPTQRPRNPVAAVFRRS